MASLQNGCSFTLTARTSLRRPPGLVRIAQAALAEAAEGGGGERGSSVRNPWPRREFSLRSPHKISKVLDEGVPETLPFELQDRSGGVSFWRNAR
jgi:hypothetical protein